MARAEQRDLATIALDERHATQNEGTHEQLAELGVGLYDLADLSGIERDGVARPPHTQRRLRRAAAQRTHLPAEIPRSQHVQQLPVALIGQQNLYAPR